MTRKGARQRGWTTEEVRALVDMAGRVTRREICRRLRRSRKSVECKAAELRRIGVPVDLRCFRSALAICPSCGRRSALLGSEGICEACRRSQQLARIESEVADLLAALPESERALYAETEAERETAGEPMPAMLPTRGVSRYRAAANEDRNDRAMEQWRVRRLRRLVRAAQKRKERIRRKAESAEVSEERPPPRAEVFSETSEGLHEIAGKGGN